VVNLIWKFKIVLLSLKNSYNYWLHFNSKNSRIHWSRLSPRFFPPSLLFKRPKRSLAFLLHKVDSLPRRSSSDLRLRKRDGLWKLGNRLQHENRLQQWFQLVTALKLITTWKQLTAFMVNKLQRGDYGLAITEFQLYQENGKKDQICW